MAPQRDQTDELQRYKDFIKNSSEGIWRCAISEPISIDLPVKEQVAHVFKYAFLAEANTAMARMYGYRSAKPLIGVPLTALMDADDPENIAYITAFIESGYNLSGVESHEFDKNGNDKYFRNSLVGTIENGVILDAWGTQQDVTEERRAITALERSEERLSLALRATSMGIWEWDIVKNELYWSKELKRLFGMKANDPITFEIYVSKLHPEDREKAQKIIRGSMLTGKSYSMEHRVVWNDGSIHWVMGQGKAYMKDGKAVRMVGTTMNIDEQRLTKELSDANTQLRTQRAQLLALNKAKDDFIALASHQLRTPATAVKQYISLLLNGYAEPLTEKQAVFLQTAFNSNERQLKIIQDLLKTAQIDSSRYVLDKKRCDIIEVVNAAVEEMDVTLSMRKQKVIVNHVDSYLVDVDVDEMRLVLLNLLENASKYSYEDSTITVEIKRRDAHMDISIIDTGVGIAKADKQRVFDKFTRIDNELSDTVTGTGLGLYWVRRIVTLHGGTIKLASQPGKGSTFTVRLPL